MTKKRQPSVFLSHSSVDKPFARRLANHLRLAGAKVWLDEAQLLPGDSLIERLREAIDNVDFLAVVLSPDAVKSRWVQKEVDVAMNQEIKGRKVKVVPLMYRTCELPWFLEGKMYADFTRPEIYGKGLRQLLGRLNLPVSQEIEARTDLARLKVREGVIDDSWFRRDVVLALSELRSQLMELSGDPDRHDLFEPLVLSYNVAINRLERLGGTGEEPTTVSWEELNANACEFCHEMRYCVVERFHEGYPLWSRCQVSSDTAPAEFISLFVHTERTLNQIIEIALAAAEKHLPHRKGFVARRVAVCLQGTRTFGAGSVVLPFLGVGFVRVPPALLLSRDAQTVLMHEAGYVLWSHILPLVADDFSRGTSRVDGINGQMLVDVLCDHFATCVAYSGSAQAMQTSRNRIVSTLTRGRARAYMTIRSHFRAIVSSALFEKARDESLVEHIRAMREDLVKLDGGPAEERACYQYVDESLRFVETMCEKHPRFARVLEAISELAHDPQLRQAVARHAAEIERYCK